MKLMRIIISIVLLIFVFATGIYAEVENPNVFAGKYTTIFCDKGTDFDLINMNVRLSLSCFYDVRGVLQEGGLERDKVFALKVDAIVNKVEEILDMYPKKFHVTLNIYKTRDDLNRVYEEIFDDAPAPISFYIYKTNTIYLVEADLNEKVLSHEIAHAIIDHYFVILPPVKIQEMLAVYADVHLNDET
jgi:hypothetical protein